MNRPGKHAAIPPPARQAGVVLPLTLVFSLLLALLAATSLQGAGLQLRMLVNARAQREALVLADALVHALLGERNNFRPSAQVGRGKCLADDTSPLCEDFDLEIPVGLLPADGVRLAVRIVRQYPELETRFAMVGEDPVAHAIYELQIELDASAVGSGSADIAQGVAVPQGAGPLLLIYWRQAGLEAL